MRKSFCVPWGLAVLFWQSTPKARVLTSFQKILIYCQNLFIGWRNVSVIMAAAQGPKFLSWLNSSTRIVYSCYGLTQGYGQLKKWHRWIACINAINWWKSLWRIRADFSSTLHCVEQYGMARKVSKANSSYSESRNSNCVRTALGRRAVWDISLLYPRTGRKPLYCS